MSEPLTCPCGGIVSSRRGEYPNRGWYWCSGCDIGYGSLGHPDLMTETARRTKAERTYLGRKRPRLGSGSQGAILRRYGGQRLLAALSLVFCMLGCAVSSAEPAPRNHVQAFACYEAFYAAREAWEVYVGPVPERCLYLDTSYLLEVQDDLECPDARAIGCHSTKHWIRIRASMTPERTVEASVHEWMHALSLCVTGNSDHDHTDPSVFGADKGVVPEGADWEPVTAQRYAIAIAPVGPCLEGL